MKLKNVVRYTGYVRIFRSVNDRSRDRSARQGQHEPAHKVSPMSGSYLSGSDH